jgi:hypothetical protein
MSREDVAKEVWKNMKVTYRKMGLSEEEIAERILCKTTNVLEGKGNLDECDEHTETKC